MATTRGKFGYTADDAVSVLPSDDPAGLSAAGAPSLSTDGTDSIHDEALTLTEVLRSAGEMADALERRMSSDKSTPDDTTRRAIAQVVRLLGQAATAMETVETSLGIEREENEPATEPEPESPATRTADLVRRAMQRRRTPAPEST